MKANNLLVLKIVFFKIYSAECLHFYVEPRIANNLPQVIHEIVFLLSVKRYFWDNFHWNFFLTILEFM